MFDICLCSLSAMYCISQNVPPAILLRFLREHRSEWADNNIDAYSAAAVKVGPCSLAGSRVGSFGGQVILPLAHTIEHEEVSNMMIRNLHLLMMHTFVLLMVYTSWVKLFFLFLWLLVLGSH